MTENSVTDNNPSQIEPTINPSSITTSVHNTASPPTRKKKYFWIGIFVFTITIVITSYFLINKKNNSTITTNPENHQSFIANYSQQISNLANTVLPNKQESPSPSPSPVLVQSSFDEIISTGSYQEKQIDYQQNDGAKLQNNDLKIKLPKDQQSFTWINRALAAELQPLFPIYLQNPEISILNDLAHKLNLQGAATYPESNKNFYIEYRDANAKLVYNPTAGFGTLRYEAKPDQGTLPSLSEAERLATQLLQSLNISLDGLTAKPVVSSLASEYENFSVVHPTIAVNYYLKKDGQPVVFADKSLFTNSSDDPSSPQIMVVYSGSGKLTRIFHGTYGQLLSLSPVNLNYRSRDLAVTELQTYGGHLRSIVELEGSRSHFACANNQCAVHNATITSVELGYYWNNSLPALSYTEINDNNPRAFEYLIPVWIFEGTGLMDKSSTDENGKLLENIDKSNPNQYYSQPVRFTATVPAFTQTNDVNLLSFKNYNLTNLGNNQAKISFESSYSFPTLNFSHFSEAEPRNGIKYRLLFLFPDKTYSIINGYKDEVYPGEVTFDLGDTKGTVTTYLEFSDFSNLIEKRTLEIN